MTPESSKVHDPRCHRCGRIMRAAPRGPFVCEACRENVARHDEDAVFDYGVNTPAHGKPVDLFGLMRFPPERN